MRKEILPLFLFACAYPFFSSLSAVDYVISPAEGCDDPTPWRSELYPENWEVGYVNAEGYGLHDFSYAGYHSGEVAIPEEVVGAVVLDVTEAPFHADNSGQTDSTAAIQAAIDALSGTGGVVFLPAGTYKVSPPEEYTEGSKRAVFHIDSSNIVFRGAGPEQTFIVNSDPMMRSTSIFYVAETVRQSGGAPWYVAASTPVPVVEDIVPYSSVVKLEHLSDFEVGEWVIIREDVTEDFMQEYGEGNISKRMQTLNLGQVYLRKIVGLDDSQKLVEVDLPIRSALLTESNTRMYRVRVPLEEVGIEHFSVGMVENIDSIANGETRMGDEPGGDDVEDWIFFSKDMDRSNWTELLNSPLSALYPLHDSYVLSMEHVVNSWVRNVHTFKPAENEHAVHILSNGFRIEWSRQITVVDSSISHALFIGGGGNGYGISLAGQDCLIRETTIDRVRRPVAHRFRGTNGNVVLNSFFRNSTGADWHMWLSPANLMDNVTVENCVLEARFRGADHGYGTTESVLWNSNGIGYRQSWYAPQAEFIIDTCQYGKGYVIGTRGSAPNVRANACDDSTPDWVEGVGRGDTLEPQSLYLDQLQRRVGTP